MKIIIVEPLKHPYVEDMDGSLKAMQEIIGGGIHATHPFDDSVNVVTTDMGQLIEHPMNRVLRDEDGRVDDVLCGTFLICGDGFVSLTDEQVKRYTQLFYVPEVFLHIGDRIIVLQVPDYEDKDIQHEQ